MILKMGEMMTKSWTRSVSTCNFHLVSCSSFFFKVDAFLEAHDSGLTEEDKVVAEGQLYPSTTETSLIPFPYSRSVTR